MAANSTLTKIISEAKKLKKAHPKKYAKWTDYVKAASKNIKPLKKTANKKVAGWKKGTTRIIEKNEKPVPKVKNVRVLRNHKKDLFSKPGTFNKFKTLAGLFDTSVIKDIDLLKKQYQQLAKKYHPDAGGTHEQFIQLKNEYDLLFKNLLNGSTLNEEQKANEIEIDKNLQDIIDGIITLPDLTIELKGKWIWLKGNGLWVPEIKNTLYKLGFPPPFKKGGVWYRIYKGIESTSRGKMSMDEINRKYGNVEFAKTKPKEIKGIGAILSKHKNKLKIALKKLTKAINKRPV
jgi:hypothetical protein